MTNNFILADNQDITRAGLISFLKEIDDSAYVTEVTSSRLLLDTLRLLPKSVVVVDYSLFDFSSFNQLINIKAGARESSWLLFSDELDEHFLRQLLMADPTISVAMKHNTKTQVMNALRCISVGEVYWCDFAESVMKSDVLPLKIIVPLTASEKNILHEIALGKSTKEIAYEKNLSFHTVNAHRRNIYRKLGVNSVNEATRYALQAGLIDMMEYYI